MYLVEKGEFKPGGARVGPEDACWACWVRMGRRMWLANALVQARPNCWRKEILGVGDLPISIARRLASVAS